LPKQVPKYKVKTLKQDHRPQELKKILVKFKSVVSTSDFSRKQKFKIQTTNNTKKTFFISDPF